MNEDELLADGRLRALCGESVDWMCTTCGTHAKAKADPCVVCQALEFTSSCSRCKAKGVTPGERACRSVERFRENGDVAFPSKRGKTRKAVASRPPPRLKTFASPPLIPAPKTPPLVYTRESAPTPPHRSTEHHGSTVAVKIAAKVPLYIVAAGAAIVGFHAPLAYIVGKAHEIGFGGGFLGSVSCSSGWIGSAVIWVSLAALVGGFVAFYRSKKAEMLYGAVIVAGLSAWYVRSHLDAIGSLRSAEVPPSKVEPNEPRVPANAPRAPVPPQVTNSEPMPKAQEPVNSAIAKPDRVPTIIQSGAGNPPGKLATHAEPPPGDPAAGSKSIVPRVEQTGFMEIESTDGRKIRAKILTLTITSVFVRRDDGSEFEIPLSRLTDTTRKNINDWRAATKRTTPPQ